MRALDLLCKLCDSGELFRPLGEFLHIEAERVKQYACQLLRETGRRLTFGLGRLLRPMFQAYTLSMPIQRLGDFPVGQITEGFPYLARSQMMSNLQATTQAMRAYAQRGIPAADVEPPLESHGTIPLAARPPLFQPKWIPNGLIRLTTDCRQSPPHDILKASRAVAKMLKSGAPAAASSIIRMDEQQCVTNHRLCHTELLEKRTQQ